MRNRGHRNLGFFFFLTLDVFAIVSFLLFVLSAIGAVSVYRGWLPSEFWMDPILVTVFVLFVSFMLTVAVGVVMRHVVLEPLQDMLFAMSELKRGNFGVRVESGSSLKIREIEDFTESYNAAAESLGETEILRRDFINDFSHELKTPIASISGFAELLCEPDLSEEERAEYAGIIAKESKRLVSLSSSILELRKAEAKGSLSEEEIGRVRFDEQLRQALLLVGEKWAGKELSFDVDLHEAHGAGSEGYLNQVWINLLDNACKFSPDGGTVSVSMSSGGRACSGAMRGNGHFQDGADGRFGSVRVRIENTGPEIAPEQLERVFDRFYQADSSHSTQGCGLGLALAKRIVELHHGAISIASEKGLTAVSVDLPVAEEPVRG